MSVIAVDNIPPKVNLKDLVKELRKPIRGNFEALNFGKKPNPNGSKICYIQLSEKLDPVHVVENINNSRVKYVAYVPNYVPDIQSVSMKTRLKHCTPAVRKQLLITQKNANGQNYTVTTNEIMCELQAKYPRLYTLNKKYDHKLFQDLNEKIYNRVKTIIDDSDEQTQNSCFKATRLYRKVHPHSEDFQLVQSTVHAIQEAAGIPKSLLQESDIIEACTVQPDGNNIPKEKINSLCNKYSSKIVEKMTEHLDTLDSCPTQLDSAEETAKKQVRRELKKLQPFLNFIVHQVVTRQLTSEDQDYKMRIYGEPTLPDRPTMLKFLARFKPRNPARSKRMHNMLLCTVSPDQYPKLMAMNGTTLAGAMLHIGRSDVIMFKTESSSKFQVEGEHDEEQAEDEMMDEQDVLDMTEQEMDVEMDVEDY